MMDTQLLEHPKSPSFNMDAYSYSADMAGLPSEQYLYSNTALQSPYSMSMSLPISSPRLEEFSNLQLTNSQLDYYSSGSYGSTASPARPITPPDAVSPPTLTYNISGGELSSDGMPSGRSRRGSGTQSPSSLPRSARYNPMASQPRTRVTRRKSRNDDSDDEDDDFQPQIPAGQGSDMRRETIRRQRIESEQRRRDELRDGYRRLKDALPVSNQKSSKVSLLDRAVTHIKCLEMTSSQMQTRLQQAEDEVARLRHLNEQLMINTAERHAATAAVAIAAAQQQQQQSQSNF
ncbi:hypothetical protein PLICRDRAFT_36234 [Plicaturopsis crispa FD-325 SS-3]|nr:hypothetical protein PLICRDRAFT_36234 [Plicaturopsis crispa FD-325 SS-3]